MTEVWFYQLERTRLEQALPSLLEKTLERGWKALVKVGSKERMEALDTALWTYREDSFLPHGLVTEKHPEDQPVLLTTGDGDINDAELLFLVDGAHVPALERYKRCVVLFDGRDDDAKAEARVMWKQLTADGLDVSYWRQTAEGRWEKQT